MEMLHIENLKFKYSGSDSYALCGVSADIARGDFVVICGESGCGKTTLLKLLKASVSPSGEIEGEILYNGCGISENDNADRDFGYVFQNPDSQIVSDSVFAELIFGLENTGLPTAVIRRRAAETACYFGIEGLMKKSTAELSGGEKQLLNLASVVAMRPKVLLLDEPTAHLDPIAAGEFIAVLKKLNSELGITVIIVEHRLEDLFSVCNKALVMDGGSVTAFDDPRKIAEKIRRKNASHPILNALPVAVRVFESLGIDDTCPISVNEGREFLSRHFKKRDFSVNYAELSGERIAEVKNISFRYTRDGLDVLKDFSLDIYSSQALFVLGGNGSGKTTLLKILAGLLKPYRGKVKICGKSQAEYRGNSLYNEMLAMLPQNPLLIFTEPTVYADFYALLSRNKCDKEETENNIDDVARRMGITHLLSRHPYDLSGGELQKCAIAKLLLQKPRVMLLDEPTNGLDATAKLGLTKTVCDLKKEGIAVVAVTHDIEFAAQTADCCAMIFGGEVVSCEKPNCFFAENAFYTTAASAMARDLNENIVTYDEILEFCRGEE